MDQPPSLAAPVNSSGEESEPEKSVPLPFLFGNDAETDREEPFVIIARDPLELCRWLNAPAPCLQWIQVENLLGEPEVWATAARKGNDVPLDVIVDNPADDFAALYRLVDVRNTRSVRVSLPLMSGFLKALRLAASIQLPVRLLLGQPDEEVLSELEEAVDFYLHDPTVESPVEFFHSALAAARGLKGPDLWIASEQDPEAFASPAVPGFSSVLRHIERLQQEGAECVGCSWKDFCLGYFKQPDPDYSCKGILRVFEKIHEAAREMDRDLESNPAERTTDPESLPEPKLS